MPPKASYVVNAVLGAVGVAGALFSGIYVYKNYLDEQEYAKKNRQLIQLAALTLSNDVVASTWGNKDIQSEFATFGLQVLTHPKTVAALKEHFEAELVGDTASRQALKEFIVDSVILDNWVKDELIAFVSDRVDDVKVDPDLFPGRILGWLGNVALTSMATDRFHHEVKVALMKSAWQSFLGPPSSLQYFDPIYRRPKPLFVV